MKIINKFKNARIKLERKIYSIYDPLKAPNPAVVYVIVNSGCNLYCKMCDVGQKNRDSQFALNMLSADQDMDFEIFKKIVDEVAFFKPVIAITSTEPLIWKNLIKAIDYAKQKECPVQVTTNGLLLPKKIDSLIEAKLDSLWVSIDGIKELHNEIRGHSKSFENIKVGFLKAKDKIKTRGINHVISNYNYHKVVDFAKEIVNFHPTVVSFSHLNFITKEMADTHNKIYGKKIPATPTCIDSVFPEKVDYKILYEQVQEAEEILKKEAILVEHSPKFKSIEDIKDYYNNPSKIVAKKECRVPWEQAQFMANGDMIIMTRCFHVVMGNIKDSSFQDLWNSEKMKDFRKELMKAKMFPACTRCCGVL